VLNSNHSLYHTPVYRAVQGNVRAEAMEPHTCSQHAEHSATTRHTFHQKEHRMSDVTMLATGLGFPEGPVVCHDGSVVLTEIRHGRCTRGVAPTAWRLALTARSLCATTAEAGMSKARRWGKARTPTTRVGPSNALTRTPGNPPRCRPPATAPRSRRRMTWCAMGRVASLAPPSASALRVIGTMGGVYYALPDGSKRVELAFPLVSPKGCGLSPDGTMLSVADTEGARLWAFDVEAPGVLRAPEPCRPHSGRVIAGLPGNARFDSVAVMASGTIAVATRTTGSMTEFSPAGDLVREVKMPEANPAMTSLPLVCT
jgi:gluconolactonase